MRTGPVAWVALRQALALRDSVVVGIAGRHLPAHEDLLGQWLGDQGFNGGKAVPMNGTSSPCLRVFSEVRLEFYGANNGVALEELAREDDCPDPQLYGLGEQRSGAGFSHVANFIITSAFVRLLGAEEQFEVDVLKALFHYRPQGADGVQTLAPVVAEASVIREKPIKDGNGKLSYSKPHLWTWLRGKADNRWKRYELFRDVFGIKVIPDDCDQAQKDEWYKKRNKIAHGFEGVTMSLAEYVSVEVFVAKTVMFVCQQCHDKLKLII